MTCVTGRCGVGEAGRMTTVAGHVLVSPGQRKACLIVRPGRWLPIGCAMTLCAIRRKSRQCVIRVSHTGIVGMMASITRRWSSRVPVRVTVITCSRPVRACEREPGQVVIERRWLPAQWRVTLLTVR